MSSSVDRILAAVSVNGAEELPEVNTALPIEGIAVVAARVDAMPPPRFLAAPVWPADAYGIIGAENKAGKTWAINDLAVTASAGRSWLGQFPVEKSGPVLLFLGEGGERKTIRRLRAVCDHYEVRLEDLPIRVCHRVPQLTSEGHIGLIRTELRNVRPVVVVVDPLYLAAKGAKASSLFEMAAVLEPIQVACQEADSALVVVHHWNKTGDGRGRDRFSGAGSAEWGRVLASVSVETKRTDVDGASNVVLAWQFIGDEIPDTEVRIRRRVHAADAGDLSSPMAYSVERLDDRESASATTDLPSEKPAVRRVWAHLKEAKVPLTVNQIGDLCAGDKVGIPLKERTIQDALARLRELDRAHGKPVPGSTGAFAWVVRTEGAHAQSDEDVGMCL